jgi:hypothetical protein
MLAKTEQRFLDDAIADVAADAAIEDIEPPAPPIPPIEEIEHEPRRRKRSNLVYRDGTIRLGGIDFRERKAVPRQGFRIAQIAQLIPLKDPAVTPIYLVTVTKKRARRRKQPTGANKQNGANGHD